MPDLRKQKEFNAKMGKHKKFPRHLDLSKGGMVDKRKHFDSGGVATTTASSPSGAGAGDTTQGGLFGALTSQSGYQAQLAPTTQFNYSPTVGAASTSALDSSTVNNAIGAEQNLASQYGDIAAGRGPNPAQTMLNQETGTNVANQAALMAGQRGSSANVGLIARQAGQQGAATQQQAVGQGATMQANQQLGALGAQGALQGQIASQGLGEQGVGANVYATGAGANNSQNSTNVANYGQAQGLNQATSQANAANTQQTSGGILGGIGSLMTLNKGGEVEHFDGGGPVLGMQPMPGVAPAEPSYPSLGVDTTMPTLNPNNGQIAQGTAPSPAASKPANSGFDQSKDPTGYQTLISGIGGAAGKSMIKSSGGSGGGGGGFSAVAALLANGGNVCKGPHQSHVANFLAQGGSTEGKVPALVSAKEVYLNPRQVNEVVERGADPMKIGHHFPGKDKVKHNSLENDVIPTELEDGGVVVPIDVTTHKDASEKARQFVVKAHAKRYLKKPKGMK